MMSRSNWQKVVGLAIVAGALAWAYWPTLTTMADKWTSDPQYSHGFLVPVFALYLLWHRRRLAPPGGQADNFPTLSKHALTGEGFDVIERSQPSLLVDGSILITGEVDRTTDF